MDRRRREDREAAAEGTAAGSRDMGKNFLDEGQQMPNSSSVSEFLLLAFADTRELHFRLFLGIYLAALLAEFSILTVMSYDRYIAIYKPLHYGSLLGSRACAQMAAAAWGSGFLHAVLHRANTFYLPLCQGNAVDQFFCEIPQILKLFCSDACLREAGVLMFSSCLTFGCFVFIVFSFVQIFWAVLRVPSEQDKPKDFSMCLPHLVVVSLFLSTAIFAYLKPPSISSLSMDFVVAVLYSVVPSSVNPLIYSMRNQELKDAVRNLFGYLLLQHR
ncbi:olfactory receptor 14J1-like [Anser cygnoides]|uniref:olfactory receptor 14J1-like n=1 Tax=Anser cygnoides TaxID=8845 RepID=UPI0034D160F1